MDFGWRFALGHATDPDQDFGYSKAGFFNAKAGYSDGPAAGDFDDRGWRVVNLPHDWAIELPFDPKADGGHGHKPVGRGFPATSVGWYRKTFQIPKSDDGKRIWLQFDGVFRNATVFVNGFAFGPQRSGYSGFRYDVTDVLDFGGNNTVAVRVDATLPEGWFYEGAGIYRHVWLIKTDPLHVAHDGTQILTSLNDTDGSARVSVHPVITNDGPDSVAFDMDHTIYDSDNRFVGTGEYHTATLGGFSSATLGADIDVKSPKPWSLESPNLYKCVTTIRVDGKVVDQVETTFGIRTIKWDANQGFFLNGKRVQINGVCNHQDHAGVGVAVPDALNVWRLKQIKAMGVNALRTSHNPPTPEILDACDRLGILVMDETRQTGVDPQALDELERLIKRDRNHPSVFVWSIGNEEWGIEGNPRGARVTEVMQRLAHKLDPSRLCTLAISGGWGNGSSNAIDVMGFNYFTHGNADDYHKRHPDQPSIGTEDGSTLSTRGLYVEDDANAHLTAYDKHKPSWASLANETWSFYAQRPWIAGMFIWTGFDYRGETTPFGWPGISSQFGLLDTCGFWKDNAWYYFTQWSDKPVVHLLPHWNWEGSNVSNVAIWAYSNCDEVELLLNDQSLGRKPVAKYRHVGWDVDYAPGTLVARGYRNGELVATDRVETTGKPSKIALIPDRQTIDANGQDVSIITVRVNDDHDRLVPTAADKISFSIDGPGRIIGVGNGDPSCHEPDQYVDQVATIALGNWKTAAIESTTDRPEVGTEFDDSSWRTIGPGRGPASRPTTQPSANAYRATLDMPADQLNDNAKISLLLRSFGPEQWVYLNGQLVGHTTSGASAAGNEYAELKGLHAGKNIVAVIATPTQNRGNRRGGGGGGANAGPGAVRILTPAGTWKRSAFAGLAQVIIQSDRNAGDITLTASADGLTPATLKLSARQVPLPPTVP